MSRQKMFNDTQVQRMKEAYTLGGATLQKIAVDFGVSVPTIAKYLVAADVEIRPRGRRPGYKVPAKVDATPEPEAANETAPVSEEQLGFDIPVSQEEEESTPEPPATFRF